MGTSFTEMPLILHIPHSSFAIPDSEMDRYLLSRESLKQEMDKLVDWATDRLYSGEGDDEVLVFPWSRFFVDLERFENDADEPMAERGMGVLYTRDTEGRVLRNALETPERERLLDAWYRPWHQRLTDTVDDFLKKFGRALIVDGHSFPTLPLPCDQDQTPKRPDFCIGTDAFHTPESLQETAVSHFRNLGYSVEINKPYAGTMVPLKHYGKNDCVHSLMIEVNRHLWGMNAEDSVLKKTRSDVQALLAKLREWDGG